VTGEQHADTVQHADRVRRHYAIIHGSEATDPLDALLAENQRLRDALERIAAHDLHVDYADVVLRQMARDVLARDSEEKT
jgi:hypothetical protein